MRQENLALVIPTLNEQGNIGRLLDSVKKQTLQPDEIVVVDACSKDATLTQIAQRQDQLPQLRFLVTPRHTIGRQRNIGVSSTFSERILFLDADTWLKDPQTIEKYLAEVSEHGLQAAACRNLPINDTLTNRVYFLGKHQLFKASVHFWPVIVGVNFFTTRDLFNQLGGYNEKIRIGEDIELFQRVLKSGARFKFLRYASIHESTRRTDEEGIGKFIIKMIRSYNHVRKNGFEGNPTPYNFGHFDKGLK